MDERVHIALVANGPYLPGLRLTKASMIAAAKHPEKLVFHEFNVDEYDLSGLKALPPFKGGHAAYFRLLFPKLLPELDRVVYADVDTVWFRDPEELWSIDTHDKAIWWVKDIPSTRYEDSAYDPEKYGCTGVMLMNLKAMRERDVLGKCLAFGEGKTTLKYADQDLLNGCAQDDSAFLPPEWDIVMEGVPERGVYHVVGIGQHFGKADTGAAIHSRLPQHALWFKWYDELVRGIEPVRRHRKAYELIWRIVAIVPRFVVRLLPARCELCSSLRRLHFFARMWMKERTVR